MSEKKLPLVKSTLVTSECWTCFKFSILQTISSFPAWLANHMSIFTTDQGNTYFGENGEISPISYYNEILEMSDGNILSVSPDQLIAYLKKQIDNGYYILLDLNYNRIRYPDWDRCWWVWIHEVLVYGYNENGLLIATTRNNGVVDLSVSVDTLITAYTDLIVFYQSNPSQLYDRRDWFLGITLIKPIDEYQNENAHYDFIKKLQAEIASTTYTKTYVNPEGELSNESFCVGLACIETIANKISTLDINDIDFDEKLKRYMLSCIAMYDHHNIIKTTLNWFIDTVCPDNHTKMTLFYNRYTEICKQLYTIVMLFYKYKQNRDHNILMNIPAKLQSILHTLRITLIDGLNSCKEIYSDHLQSTVCQSNATLFSSSNKNEYDFLENDIP